MAHAPPPRPGDDLEDQGPSLARFAVRQPVLVNLVAIAAVIVGAFILSGMTREVYPTVPVGGASIITTYPGASPEEVEQLVTAVLEDEIANVEDLDVIVSTSSEGLSFIWVEMDASVRDTGRKVLEIVNEVNRASARLPAAADPPVVREAAVRVPVLAVSVRGEVPERTLRAVGRDLERRIERLDGVGQIQVTGVRDRELQIDVDPERLAAYGLPLEAVADALSRRGGNVPAGQLEGARRQQIVRGMAQARDPSTIEEIVVRPSADGGSIRVRDVATVSEGFARALTTAHVDGEPAIVLLVMKDDGADALRLSEDVRALVASLDTPPGVSVGVFGDVAPYVRAELFNLYSNAAIGLLLVLAILWLFIGLRNGLMAAVGIPVAIAGGVIAMHLLGITINLLSLLALILSLGVIVDDAIIIIENVYRHMQAGLPRRQAAVVGTQEVLWPVLASTATTCSAFLPLLLMTGVLGEFFAIIPKVIVAALIASLVEAFFILPSHMADFGSSGAEQPSRLRAAGARFGAWVEDRFERTLRWALARRGRVLVMTYLLCAALLASAAMLKEVVLFTDGEVEMFDVRVRMPTDASPEETDRILLEIDRRIRALESPDVEAVISSRGYSRTRGFDVNGDHVGMVTVYIIDRADRSSLDAGTRLMARSMTLFEDLVGPASLDIVKFEDGPPRGAPVAIRLMGDDVDRLAELSEQVQAEVRRIPGVRDVGDDHELGKQEVRVVVDESRAALHGLSTSEITRWLALAFGAAPVTKTRDGDEEVGLLVRLDERARSSPERVGELELMTPRGALIALRDVANLEVGRGLSKVRRRDRRRSVTVTAELVEGSGATSAEVNRLLSTRLEPLIRANPSVRFQLGGEYEETNESLETLFLAFILAALLIYTILASQFRSFIQPLVVMTAIPLSMIGVSIGFFVSGEPIGLIGLIGVVGLTGIVVNDSLVLVDFINARRRAGAPVDEAIVEAAKLRLRPIFLTSVTTIAGLFPLAIGIGGRSELLAPMATAISWGLSFSTILILVMVPCLYRSADGLALFTGRVFAPLTRRLRGDDAPESASSAPAE